MSNPTEEDLTAAFEAGFDAAQPDGDDQHHPAADGSAPAGPEASDEAATNDGAAPEDDELAGLPPRVRAALAELEELKQTARVVPTLEHKLRSAEGRIAALQKAVPAPPPPAPPRLETVERVRAELPEVVEAMEELFAAQRQQAATTAPEAPSSDAVASLLEAEAPGWETKVAGNDFQDWLKQQPDAYREKVATTTSEAVMLAAIAKFDTHQEFKAQRQREDAGRRTQVDQTRQARASAAVVPNGAGRRAPSDQSVEAAFLAGFNGG